MVLLAIALLLCFVSSGLAQLTFPTFSGRVISGPDDIGLAGVGVSWTLSPNNGGISGGGFTTTDANGNYTGTFNAASMGSGFEWRFTFTKANHTIEGFDRRVVGTNGNFVMPYPLVRYGPLTGQALSGTFGVPGVLIFPGGTNQYDTTSGAGSIPNNSNVGIESTRQIDEPGIITSLTVRPVITHPRAGDLEITLIHPDGTSVVLRKTSSDNSAYTSPTYSVAAGNSFESLAVLNGKTRSGIWKLVVRDPAGGSGSAGTLASWTLVLTVPPVVTDANGNFNAGIAKNYRAIPSHPLVSSFTSTFTDIPSGVPTTLRVNQGRIVGRINPTTTSLLLQQKILAGIQLRAQQPPGNTSDTSWGIMAPELGTYDLAFRTTDGVNFSQRLLSGANNTLVIPSGRGITFSPANITSYAGATNVNFTITASPPAIGLPASVTMTEDSTFFGIATVADLEQAATALNITSTYSDNPQLINGDGIVVTGPTGAGTTRSLNLTPIPNQFGSATIFVVISDGALFTTNSFPLTVTPVADTPTAGTTGALRLDGVDDYVAVSPGPVIPTSGNFTVEAWAFANAGTTGTREILSQGSGGNAFYIGMHNGIVRAGDTWQNPGNVSFPVGVWTHFAVVKSGGSAFLYTNGVLVASIGSGVANPAATEFRIGRQYGGNGEYWAGRIDDVRVWNTARTESDIRRTMTVPLIGNEPGLRAYYRFDEGSGIIAYDSAPSLISQSGPEDGYLKSGAGWTDNTGINGGLGIHRYTVDEDTATPIYLTGLDVDGRPVTTNLTYTFDSLPLHGTLSRSSGSLHLTGENPIIYTPATNYIGPDSFNYRITDGTGLAKGATVSINVANVNDIPTISAIPDQLVIEDTTNVIAFVVNDSDVNQVKADLAVTVSFESGGTVPIQTNWVTTANGTNRTLYIVPAKGEIGNVIVTVRVTDTPSGLPATADRTFELAVIPKPAYAVRDIGTLPGWSTSFGMAINEQGQVAGYAGRNSSADGRAFRFNGILDGSTLTDLGAASGSASYAYGINNAGEVTGSVIEGGALPQAFFYRNGTFTKLGFAPVGNRSEGRAINGLGQIVGFGNVTANATNRALIYTNGVWAVLPSLIGNEVVEAFGINDAGQIAGRAVTNGVLRAVLYTAGTRLVAPLIGGAVNNYANAINSAGAIAGAMTIGGTPRAFRWEQGQNSVLLGGFIPNGYSVAHGINNFRQTVGAANNAAGTSRAFLHSAEQIYDMNDLLPPDSQWQLDEARAINSDGWITGTGRTNGQTRAFIAIPAWVIGRKIARPLGATALVPPEIELLERSSNFDTEQNAFYWSQAEGRLYAIRPVTARLRWRLDGNPGNTNRVVSVGQNIWPRTPTVHVANTPSEVQPQGVELPHSYRELQYTTAAGAAVDPSAAIFNASGIGYSVLRYVKSDGQSPNEAIHFPAFDVVRTVLWDDTAYLDDNKPAFVGDTLEYPGHFDYLDRQGHVFFPNAFYDGSGADRAYDRPTRFGSIIPVNVPNATTAAPTNQLVVVWYRTNRLGVAWSGLPVRYAVEWPVNTTNLISIANGLGSGPLEDALHPNKKVYVQPDPYLSGYNPNEEHALIGPSSSGEALYALRNDLNAGLNVSEPYALLKFRSPATSKWAMRTFKVIFEGDPTFDGVAGNAVQPPLPISLMMPQCDNSRILRGPGWKNHLGTIYAKSAGLYGEHAEISIHWWYQLQPGFYYPADGKREGNCVDWLASANGRARQIEAIYDIRWPDDPPILNIGESLLTPKRGLPGVKDWADASIIYDDIDPRDTNRIYALVRFYDPLTPRTITLKPGFNIPVEIKQELVIDKVYFPDLPYHIKRRLTYNPQTRELTFAGVLDTSAEFGGVDNPLLLPNVMSPREFDRIKALANDSTWNGQIRELSRLTRNPNRVDLSPMNGQPDAALRLGLTMSGTDVVLEKFGSGPKALTAGLGGIPPAEPRPLKALNFNGASDPVVLGSFSALDGDFTISTWAKVATANNANGEFFITSSGFEFTPQPGASRFRISDRPGTDFPGIVSHVFDTNWHHYALVRESQNLTVFVDGVRIGSAPASGLANTAGFAIGQGFNGQLDEFQIWNVALGSSDLKRRMRKQLNGREDGLVAYFRFDEGTGTTVTSETISGLPGSFNGSQTTWVDSTAPAAIPPRFITLAENNDANRPELPTTLYVVRIDEGPTLGDLKVLPSDNVFDERITMRHSGDFGGAPELMQFEWYYHPDTGGEVATDLPVTDSAGNIIDPRGWFVYSVEDAGQGFNDITIGEGPRNGLLTMSDNWFICRYRGYNIDGSTNWTDWVGQPGGGRAQLAEGWIKRVIDGLNPFEQRSDSFHSTETSTLVNMLTQAGRRYEGPVAFNPDPNYLNNVGLIEAYTTVLERGKSLSIEGTPPVNYEPANTSLLLIGGRLADFYMMLGNEAYADSTDPTIGFATDGTGGTDYGVFASSIFAFQNQLDSLLEEELVLLRGRDDSAASVRIGPVYNRLFWNFTRGDGELAYSQSYNIIDVNFDGFVNINDASTMFPQGHGDAWGHYLTATKTYYDLLRNTNYTWVPRAESVRLGAAVVSVDYLDERKFARAAAAKAKVGAETVNLTYRQTYVDDPSGQFQGYKDTDDERAWGLFEWAQRTRQAAYVDWLMANTILPAQDPDPTHSGITKIDRTTVTEIAEIAANADEIQSQLDKSDRGLNPLGLGKGVVPFDVDPFFLDIGSGTQSRTHFDQIYERAETAMNNAMNAFNNASQLTTALRRQQDSDTEFARNIQEQERDYKSRLIEIFGYPYAGDIGPGKTYPSDYDGPDIYHYMYANATELISSSTGTSSSFTNVYSAFEGEYGSFGFYFPGDTSSRALENSVLRVAYPKTAANYSLLAPASWGQRRAPGEVQLALSDLLQADASLRISLANYDALINQIEDAVDLLDAQYALSNSVVTALSDQQTEVEDINDTIKMYRIISGVMRRAGSAARSLAEGAEAAIEITNPFGVIPFNIAVGSLAAAEIVETVADGLDGDIVTQETSKEELELTTGLTIETAAQSFEVQQRIKEVQQLIRSEPAARIEAYQLAETVRQAATRYQAALASGQRILQERLAFRRYTAGDIQDSRYQDMTFRVFRNDAVQKYRAQFDLAARYVYLAAIAYDYETQMLGTQNGSGRDFLTQIVRDRSLGVMQDGVPVVGQPGLSDSLGRLKQNFNVLKGQLGFTVPALEGNKFSLRSQMLRISPDDDEAWRRELQKARVTDLWQVPEFRRYCRPFAPESAGAQPGLVIRFGTTVTFGLNYFGWPLGGGDSSYDPTYFATKIRSAGVWFDGYNGGGLSTTPRVYLVPAGIDVLRSPTDFSLATREWKVLDQKIPPPFTLGKTTLQNPSYIPIHDSLSSVFGDVRKFSSLRAYHDGGEFDESEASTDTRLIGRSVWNTEWMLIIPGGTLLFNPNQGLDTFVNSVGDIRIFFQSYSYSGN